MAVLKRHTMQPSTDEEARLIQALISVAKLENEDGSRLTDDGWFPDWCLMYRATKLWKARGLSRDEAIERGTHSVVKLHLKGFDNHSIETMNWCRHLPGSEYVDDTMEEIYKESPLMKNKTFLKNLELLERNIREAKDDK